MHKYFFDVNGQWRNGWKVLAYFALATVLVVATSIASKAVPAGFSRVVPGPLWGFFGLLGAAWIFLRLERAPLASLGLLVNRAFLVRFALGLGGGVGLLALLAGAVWLGGGYRLERVAGASPWILLRGAWVFLAVALFEEILFRGYAFQRAIRGIGPRAAQLVFALLFCLVHLSNEGMSGATVVVAMLNIFLASLILGYCYLHSGSLALPIGAHMGWNWAQSSLGFAGSGNTSKGFWTPVYHEQASTWLTGGVFGLEASVLGVVLLGLTVYGLARWKGGVTTDIAAARAGGACTLQGAG